MAVDSFHTASIVNAGFFEDAVSVGVDVGALLDCCPVRLSMHIAETTIKTKTSKNL